MKELACIIVSLLLFSCGEQAAEKPKDHLPEDKMVNMLYDITMLQAINSFKPQVLDSNKVEAKNYIYKKYKTDSLTFAQSHTYYASDLEVYGEMQRKVADRIEKDKVKEGIIKKGVEGTTVKGGSSSGGPKIRPRTRTLKASDKTD